MRSLGEYLRGCPPPVPPDIVLAVRTTVMRQPGISLRDLRLSLHRGNADHIHQLILTDQLYVNLEAARLSDDERVQVFLDQVQAESSVPLSLTSASLPHPTFLALTVGAPVILDGKVW